MLFRSTKSFSALSVDRFLKEHSEADPLRRRPTLSCTLDIGSSERYRLWAGAPERKKRLSKKETKYVSSTLIKVLYLTKRRKKVQTLQDVLLGRQDVLLRKKERIDFSRLWWVGLLLIVTTVVLNFVIYSAVVVLFPMTKVELDPLIFYTGLGTLGAVLVFGLVGWLAPHPITLYRMIAGGVLLLSFVPDIVLFTTGASVVMVGTYMLMHIATAVICVAGLTRFTQTRDAM